MGDRLHNILSVFNVTELYNYEWIKWKMLCTFYYNNFLSTWEFCQDRTTEGQKILPSIIGPNSWIGVGFSLIHLVHSINKYLFKSHGMSCQTLRELDGWVREVFRFQEWDRQLHSQMAKTQSEDCSRNIMNSGGNTGEVVPEGVRASLKTCSLIWVDVWEGMCLIWSALSLTFLPWNLGSKVFAAFSNSFKICSPCV